MGAESVIFQAWARYGIKGLIISAVVAVAFLWIKRKWSRGDVQEDAVLKIAVQALADNRIAHQNHMAHMASAQNAFVEFQKDAGNLLATLTQAVARLSTTTDKTWEDVKELERSLDVKFEQIKTEIAKIPHGAM